MASTYSNLKIELMATGEKATTWGTITNTNLGTAIEEAITGSADITFADANLAITLSNTNASQPARNLRLNLVGSTGGSPRTLTVPNIEKLYIVNNTCADTITVKNSAGTTVAVPAGKTMLVFSTGTGVVDVTTYLSSLTLGTALGAASGGTGLTAAGANGNVLTSNGSAWTSASLPSYGTMANQNANNVNISGGSVTGVTLGSSNASFTGTPTAPTAAPGTNTTQIATTAFVQAATTALNLGTIATQNANNVNITGGTMSGVGITTGTINSLTTASLGTNAYGTRTVSTSSPSGGSNGDIWYKV